MMIILDDMKMPKCCSDCELCYDMVWCSVGEDRKMPWRGMDKRRLDNCPIVAEIPENPTNGNVIIGLYPSLRYTVQNNRIMTTIGGCASFDLDWWNAPYKGGR